MKYPTVFFTCTLEAGVIALLIRDNFVTVPMKYPTVFFTCTLEAGVIALLIRDVQ